VINILVKLESMSGYFDFIHKSIEVNGEKIPISIEDWAIEFPIPEWEDDNKACWTNHKIINPEIYCIKPFPEPEKIIDVEKSDIWDWIDLI